jgi:hypothetical protein
MTITIQKVAQAEELEALRELTRGVLHQVCWRADLSYGDELVLHMGAKVAYIQNAMAGREKGAWILGTRGTAWSLRDYQSTLVTSDDDPEVVKQKVRAIQGSTIVAFDFSYPDLGLVLQFSGGYQLVLTPDSEADIDLPYWELFTPNHMLLEVGPGAAWRYLRSDVLEPA